MDYSIGYDAFLSLIFSLENETLFWKGSGSAAFQTLDIECYKCSHDALLAEKASDKARMQDSMQANETVEFVTSHFLQVCASNGSFFWSEFNVENLPAA